MKRWGKNLLLTGIILFVAATTMCVVGTQYEISQIPPEQRAKMTDTDWVGAEWGLRAFFVQILGLVVGLAGGAMLVFQRWQSKRDITD
jgi:hypothetical protein